MSTLPHASAAELEAGLEHIRAAPKHAGPLTLIVRRPETGRREELDECRLDPAEGLAGDNWRARGSRSMPDGSANPEMQLTVMGARAIALLARTTDQRAIAGDQLFVDLDLSEENLPPGSRLALGEAVIEVTAVPHTGCAKFTARFGVEAMKFVNSPLGRSLRLRGLNAKVVQPGTIRRGDVMRKIAATE